MTEAMVQSIGNAAYEALLQEAETTPKPGLVDRRNNGAHTDMDLPLFIESAAALRPYFPQFVRLGAQSAPLPPDGAVLASLRPAGIGAEKAMLAATHGVNTHKGAVFLLGTLCCAAGRLATRGAAPSPEAVCREAGLICAGVERELADPAASTHGARCYRAYGVTGVRGEAAKGFPSLLQYALPYLVRAELPEQSRLCAALLNLMAHVDDTTVLSRTGREGAAYCKAAAWAFLRGRDPGGEDFLPGVAAMDEDFIRRNISPGGCADLLAAALFLLRIQAL